MIISCCLSHRHWLVGWDLSNKASGWTGCHHDPGGWSALEPCGLRTEPPLGLKPEGSALQHWEAKKKKRKKKKPPLSLDVKIDFDLLLWNVNCWDKWWYLRTQQTTATQFHSHGLSSWVWRLNVKAAQRTISLPKGREAARSSVRCPAGSDIVTVSNRFTVLLTRRCRSQLQFSISPSTPDHRLSIYITSDLCCLSSVWKMDVCRFSNLLCQQYVCKNNAK